MPGDSRPILPVPDDFPVVWIDPSLADLHWVWDQMHHPYPVTPLTATFEVPAFGEGVGRGFATIGLPIGMTPLVINGYCYNANEPRDGVPPEAENEIVRRLPGLTQAWEQEFLPEIQSMNDRLRDNDYATLSNGELLAFVDETYRMRVRAWDIHMQVVIPVIGVATRFAELYENLFGKPQQGEPYQMLQGFPNMTVESGKALWALSRRVLSEPALARTVAETSVQDLPRALNGSDFWEAFQSYLEQYGWRSDAFELAHPAWIEDPAIPLNQLQDMLRCGDEADPHAQGERSRVDRERVVAEAFEQLDGNEGRPLFETMLSLAQQYLPIQENHNFYIDQMNTVLLRRPFGEIGTRLANERTVAHRDDVFYLQRDELAPALKEPSSRNWRALVAERRAGRERQLAIVPPRELGGPPPGSGEPDVDGVLRQAPRALH